MKNNISYKEQRKCKKLDEWLEDESDKGKQKASKKNEDRKV